MKTMPLIICLLSVISLSAEEIVNPAIDYKAFQTLVNELGPVREKNRVTEDAFIKMASEPNTIIFDARSDFRFKMLHVKGARHLAFADFTQENLAKVIPDKNTRILIYCNNNFDNEPVQLARKGVSVSLNVPTFLNLHAYGYTNVYELGPLLDINKTKIPFVRMAGEQTE